MDKKRREAVWIAAFLKINSMTAPDIEQITAIRF